MIINFISNSKSGIKVTNSSFLPWLNLYLNAVKVDLFVVSPFEFSPFKVKLFKVFQLRSKV